MQEIDYSIPGHWKEAYMVASAQITLQMLNDYNEVFQEIGCFKGTF